MRIPKPHWKVSHKCWYVKLAGKFHRLDPDKQKALDIYTELLNRHRVKDGSATPATIAVREVIATYLDWVERHRADDTFKWYRKHLLGICGKKGKHKNGGFANYIPPSLLVRDLKPFHLENWLDARYAEADNDTKAGAITAVQRAFNWATELGYIASNPLAKFPKPQREGRGGFAYLSPEQWGQVVEAARFTHCGGNWTTRLTATERVRQLVTQDPMLRSKQIKTMLASEGLRVSYSNIAMAKRSLLGQKAQENEDRTFQDYLVVLRETGCRPQEIRKVEARHLNHERKEWVFPAAENPKAKRKEPRVVVLGPVAYEICQRLALRYPAGKLFRNSEGKPWTNSAVASRFKRLSDKVGFKVFTYAVRHTFATEAIINGADVITVARLMGHRDLTMLNRIYEHITRDRQHLEKSRAKAVDRLVSV